VCTDMAQAIAGLEDIFRLVTDRWPEPDDDRISSFDPLSHSFPTGD
jgi:hypothetical protein